MKKVLLFYLENCPYCHYAKRAVKELIAEHPVYGEIEIEWIEESRHRDVAEMYSYYYVPTIFYDNIKLYEASPSEGYSDIKDHIRIALDKVLGA